MRAVLVGFVLLLVVACSPAVGPDEEALFDEFQAGLDEQFETSRNLMATCIGVGFGLGAYEVALAEATGGDVFLYGEPVPRVHVEEFLRRGRESYDAHC